MPRPQTGFILTASRHSFLTVSLHPTSLSPALSSLIQVLSTSLLDHRSGLHSSPFFLYIPTRIVFPNCDHAVPPKPPMAPHGLIIKPTVLSLVCQTLIIWLPSLFPSLGLPYSFWKCLLSFPFPTHTHMPTHTFHPQDYGGAAILVNRTLSRATAIGPGVGKWLKLDQSEASPGIPNLEMK